MYEIKFVEHESVFYQSGSLQVYDMRCELLEYSNQRFDTGRPEIYQYFDDMTTVMTANTGVNTLTKLANTDPIADNIFFEQEADGIIDFSEIDPFSENITIQD